MDGQTTLQRVWSGLRAPGLIAFVVAGAVASLVLPHLALVVTPELEGPRH